MTPEFIVIHTAASGKNGVVYDATAAQIDRWHKDRGWSGIGYHYVVRFNGAVEEGRAETKKGAHARGLNGKSLGICLSGHGDIKPMTENQRHALNALCQALCMRHGIPIEHIIGHREIVKFGAPDPHKTCPGTKVLMDEIRRDVAQLTELAQTVETEQGETMLEMKIDGIRQALRDLYRLLPESGCESALDELNALRREPSLDNLLEKYPEAT